MNHLHSLMPLLAQAPTEDTFGLSVLMRHLVAAAVERGLVLLPQNRGTRLEEVLRPGEHGVAQLLQRPDVVEDVKAAAVGGDDMLNAARIALHQRIHNLGVGTHHLHKIVRAGTAAHADKGE